MDEPRSTILVRRRFRVVIDVEVTVSDITPGTAAARVRDRGDYDGFFDDSFFVESAERDRRLLLAFIANQRRLTDQLANMAADHATNFVNKEDVLKTQLPADYEKHLVLDTLEDLGPEDAEYYGDAEMDGYLWEASQNFGDAFDAVTVSASMSELPPRE